jgi:hypothetical protein
MVAPSVLKRAATKRMSVTWPSGPRRTRLNRMGPLYDTGIRSAAPRVGFSVRPADDLQRGRQSARRKPFGTAAAQRSRKLIRWVNIAGVEF